jgi:hypothetical protein
MGFALLCQPITQVHLELNDEPQIERLILDYLRANPEAKDTARGIGEWWLLKQKIAEALADVKAALARLVAEGKLAAETAPDGEIYYRLRRVGQEKRTTDG